MVDGVVGGALTCSGLSDRGRLQAVALRDRLARTGELVPDAFYASTLPRAVETARIIAPALGDPALITDEELCELAPGECDGLPWAEAVERYAMTRPRDPDRALSPGGESIRQFEARTVGVVRRLLEDHAGGTTVAVCHGGIIAAATRHLMGAAAMVEDVALRLNPDVTSLTEWRLADFDGARRHLLVRFNDVGHLAADLRRRDA